MKILFVPLLLLTLLILPNYSQANTPVNETSSAVQLVVMGRQNDMIDPCG